MFSNLFTVWDYKKYKTPSFPAPGDEETELKRDLKSLNLLALAILYIREPNDKEIESALIQKLREFVNEHIISDKALSPELLNYLPSGTADDFLPALTALLNELPLPKDLPISRKVDVENILIELKDMISDQLAVNNGWEAYYLTTTLTALSICLNLKIKGESFVLTLSPPIPINAADLEKDNQVRVESEMEGLNESLEQLTLTQKFAQELLMVLETKGSATEKVNAFNEKLDPLRQLLLMELQSDSPIAKENARALLRILDNGHEPIGKKLVAYEAEFRAQNAALKLQAPNRSCAHPNRPA